VAAEAPRRRTFRVLVVLAATTIVLVGLLILVYANVGTDQPDSLVVGGHPLYGQAAPEIDLQTIDGQRLTLSSLRGRPVLVNFWASWCPPCRDEFPLMAQAYADHAADGLEILGIVHADTAAGAEAFAAEEGATWPMLQDPDETAWQAYMGIGLPTSFFIDAEGIVRGVSFGGFTPDGLDSLLAAILPTAPARADAGA
jgi:cytochrome c biogenesis protein CcmG/thiol:disulfide interchange protein DsbE